MVFTFPKDEQITGDVVQKFIDQHKLLVPKYLESKNMYEGRYDILYRAPRELYKPDNRLVVNLAKYIVDTFNGYFIGIPVKLNHDNDKVSDVLTDFVNRSNMEDNEAELSKICSIYGHGFEYLYQDEDSQTRVIYNTPIDMFIVYDDTIQQNPLFAVRYQYDADLKLSGELVDATHSYIITTNGTSSVTLSKNATKDNPDGAHYYQGVPIVEWIENEERQSIFETVKTLINAINNALSAKADDVDYFADAYLVVKGAELDEPTMDSLRETRNINIGGEGSEKVVIEFLAKPNADTTQENLIDRLLDLVFQMSMVANINDESFGSASGVALEFKLQPMKNLAIMKERKVKNAMQERFKMFFNIVTNVPSASKDEWMNIEYKFTRNIPRNIADEAETAAKLEGVVSKETQLSVLSIVPNVKEEIAKMEKEMEEAPQYDFQAIDTTQIVGE